MKHAYLVAAAALGLAAPACFADSLNITVSGAVSGSFNDTATPHNIAGSTLTSGSGTTSFSFISSSSNNSPFSLGLLFTGMTFRTSELGSQTITVHVVANYDVVNVSSNATATHSFDGNMSGNFGAHSVTKASTHESTALPFLTSLDGPGPGQYGSTPIAGNTAVTISGNVYTIDTTYVFTLASLGGDAFLTMGSSGQDSAILTSSIPLPPAAYAGLGTLALCGIGSVIRRRQLSQI